MEKLDTVRLGFAVGSGRPVDIPIGHMAVTGQTQMSGKTTTLEALIQRSGARAVAFVTKRGEGSFGDGRRIFPYFRERTDWQFVESVLESVMRQRMRFERAWVIRATKGARTLADVRNNVRLLSAKATRGMDRDVYMLLGEYLDLVVPLIDALPAADSVDLRQGLSVMDLSPYPSQMQALVIRSVMEWVYEREQDSITVVPEAWEFVPQARGGPVKLAAAQLARKGAALRNYVWLDSQDLAGVDKEILKQVSVWLLGVQREVNEVKRTLAHIPSGVAKPSPRDVATLARGQFWACWQGETKKVYVWPPWLSEEEAESVAKGKKTPRPRPVQAAQAASVVVAPGSKRENKMDDIEKQAAELEARAAELRRRKTSASNGTMDEDALYERFKERLIREAPGILKVVLTQPEIEVEVRREVVTIDGTTLRGRLAQLVMAGFFDETNSGQSAFNELLRRGAKVAKPNVYRELDKLAEMGFLTKESSGYMVVPDMKKNVRKS